MEQRDERTHHSARSLRWECLRNSDGASRSALAHDEFACAGATCIACIAQGPVAGDNSVAQRSGDPTVPFVVPVRTPLVSERMLPVVAR